MKTVRYFCKDCDDYRKCEARTPSHILHLLLAVITGGLWLIVWIILIMKPLAWKCASCGSGRISKTREIMDILSERKPVNQAWVMAGAVVGILLGLYLMISQSL